MNNLSLKELQVIREGLEAVALTADREAFKTARQKVDDMLENLGYKYERKAFQSGWKKINK